MLGPSSPAKKPPVVRGRVRVRVRVRVRIRVRVRVRVRALLRRSRRW